MFGIAANRLVVATEMDPWSSSTRYRALQYLDDLEPRFAAVTVSFPNDVVERRPGRAGQLKYFATHAGRYLTRCISLRRELRDADVVLVQRGLYPLGPGLVADAIVDFPGRVVLDLDDAVFETKPSRTGRGHATHWLYGPQQARRILERADVVVVSSAELAKSLPPASAPTVLLPTLPDVARYPLATQSASGPVVVGWAGTVGNVPFLDPLRRVFSRLATDRVATLEVVSSGDWDGPGTFRRWTLSEEANLFARFSIGIMPLPDTAYTRAKAGFKLLQYMAAGLPVVASPVGVNDELVSRSGAGFLARSPDEWEDALRMLAADCDLRLQLGAKARRFVTSYVEEHHVARRLGDILTSTF
jgi:glycosyltransferase involved in cell wall biosynthesis